MESIMTTQNMAPAPFFYYSPDPNPETRHHGHFIQQPQQKPHPMPQPMPPQQQPMAMFPVVPTLPSTPIYSRPNSSCSQPPVGPHHPFGPVPSQMTPMASPQPISQKPTIVLATDIYDHDYYPSTPPLSSSGSAISSPGSCDMLATPLNPMFSGLDGCEGVKTEVESDRKTEQFPVLDWSSCASPPLTPVYLQSQAQPKLLSLNSNSSDLLSGSCPSLSPSPSPFASSAVSEDFDFCDPRNLTVGTGNTTLAPTLPALPTLCAGDDEEHKFVLRGEAPAISQVASATPSTPPTSSPSFDFTPAIAHGLPSFDEFSDLESDDDFVNGLVNLGEQPASGQANRSRASSDAVSLGHESYVCEDDLEDFEDSDCFSPHGIHGLPSPATSCSDSDGHQDKRQRTSSPTMNSAADSKQEGTQPQNSAAPEGEQKSGEGNDSGNDSQAPTPAPANRRGRKQSLTEDPSKTFVCDICSRRFRRQEHLKRHYRSLHTADKPFECNECGKKFSRSDNLAQHSRTHGSGAIALEFDHSAAVSAGGTYPPHMFPSDMGAPDYSTLGKVLFQITADIPGSGSELSDDGSDGGKKKRKRVD